VSRFGQTRRVRKSGAVIWALMAAVTAALVAPAPMATAASGAVLPIGSTETLPAAGIKLAAPVDGRLWGYDFTGDVTGVAFASAAGPAGNTVSAPAGGQLCVFDLSVSGAEAPFLQIDTAGNPFPTATLTAGTTKISLPVGDPDNIGQYQGTLAVAVPAGAPVRLALSVYGVTQTFDLRAGHRVGLDPPALYRSTGDEPYLSAAPGVTGTLTQTGPPGQFDATYADPVNIANAYLSWFAPQPATALPPDGDAWLIVYPEGGPPQTVSDNEEYETLGLPATDVTLVSANGQRIAGQVTGQSLGGFNTDLFGGGAYYFPVPADFTGGTIDIHPSGAVAVDYADLGGQSITGHSTITVTGAVQIPVSFPATVARTAPGRSWASPSGHHGAGFPIWLIAVLAALVLAVGAVATRVRRGPRLVPRPVTRSLAVRVASADLLAPRVLGVAGRAEAAGPAILVRALGRAPDGAVPNGPPNPSNQEDATDQPVEPSAPALIVRVLGPLDVEGLTARLRRKPAQRLLVALAVSSERALSGDQLRSFLATSFDREPSAESLRTYASTLRAALPAGLLPPAGPTGGYRLAGDVEVDWAVFRSLTARARRLPADQERLALVVGALRLVRGVPLAGDTWAGIDDTVRQIEAAIERTADDGARLALELRDARTAEAIVTQGLLVAPKSPQLWELRLIAAAAGSGVGLERAWQQAQEALGEDAGLLAATYERLRTGQF
jgi:DNA-binding SARP family transcriptional activator